MNGFRSNDGTFVTESYFTPRSGSFRCKNYKKEQAKRMKQWGWQKLPDEICHYEVMGDTGYVRIPAGLSSFIPEKFVERFEYSPMEKLEFLGTLRDDQQEKIALLTQKKVGLMHASTGVGKGVMIPYLAAHLNRKTLIVVPGIQLLNEMVERCQALIGITPLTIGGKKQSKSSNPNPNVVVATIDSAVKMDKDSLKAFGATLLDEADKYVTTEPRLSFLKSITSEYQYAFTGTLQLNFIDSKVLKIYYGDITEFVKLNYVPRIFRVRTSFEDELGEYEDPKEFTNLVTAVSECQSRNDLIVSTVLRSLQSSSMRKGILLTNRTEHAYYLANILSENGITSHVIVGEVPSEERARIKQEVSDSEEPVILIGNAAILGRGFDLPKLQTVYLTYPCRFDANVIQACGRVIRPAEGKTYCEVYDFIDANVRMLKRQGDVRLRAMKTEYKNPIVKEI